MWLAEFEFISVLIVKWKPRLSSCLLTVNRGAMQQAQKKIDIDALADSMLVNFNPKPDLKSYHMAIKKNLVFSDVNFI